MERHRLIVKEKHGFEASCACGLWAIDRGQIGEPGSSRRRKVEGNILRRFTDHKRPYTLQGRVRAVRNAAKKTKTQTNHRVATA